MENYLDLDKLTDDQLLTLDDKQLAPFDVAEMRERFRQMKQNGGDRDKRASQLLPTTAELIDNEAKKLEGDPNKSAIPTPFPTVNRAMGGVGLPLKATYILSGKPEGGKSIQALEWADVATLAGWNTGFYSGEMPAVENLGRLFASSLGAPFKLFNPYSADRSGKAFRAAGRKWLANRPGTFYTNRNPDIAKIDDIVACMEVLSRPPFNVQLHIIDFLQQITVPGSHGKRDQVSTAMERIDKTAKRTGTAALVLSQLKRECYDHGDRAHLTPRASDQQWSSEIEQYARVVFVLDPSRTKELSSQARLRLPLTIEKNRTTGKDPETTVEVDLTTMQSREAHDVYWKSHEEGPYSNGQWRETEGRPRPTVRERLRQENRERMDNQQLEAGV